MTGKKLSITNKLLPVSKYQTILFIGKELVMKKQIEIHKIDISSSLPLQFADEGIKAGFPSPAQDYMEQGLT